MPVDDPIEKFTAKYTGKPVTHADLDTAADELITELADMLRSTVYSLQSSEHQLLQVAPSLQETVTAIRVNIHAAAGQPIRHLNSMGELLATGARTDMLIAQRAERIEHLRRLVWLWQHRTAPAQPADPTANEPTT